MKIVRFLDNSDQERLGVITDDHAARLVDGDIWANFTVTDKTAVIKKLLAPIAARNILCIGLNYRQHATETGAKIPEYPVLFMKSLGALQNPDDPIVIPPVEPLQVDYEGELAVVIGKTAKDVSRDAALDYVLGYTCANDVSGRNWQMAKGGSQWCRGKSFDTFCPLGPYLVTADDVPDPNDLRIKTIVNGAVMQDSTTADMIFDVRELICFLSQGTTLPPGTVILTGTPPGVGFARKPPIFLKHGDEVVVKIEAIGRLRNPVRQPEDL
ncbi:MAG: fumarylacetoacetate hydrolase family protein [Gammaproteobacteria bacterium]|nr:fumarylacetoacetate hydrolase family protein [Gammaproteobacteria bacterium]